MGEAATRYTFLDNQPRAQLNSGAGVGGHGEGRRGKGKGEVAGGEVGARPRPATLSWTTTCKRSSTAVRGQGTDGSRGGLWVGEGG